MCSYMVRSMVCQDRFVGGILVANNTAKVNETYTGLFTRGNCSICVAYGGASTRDVPNMATVGYSLTDIRGVGTVFGHFSELSILMGGTKVDLVGVVGSARISSCRDLVTIGSHTICFYTGRTTLEVVGGRDNTVIGVTSV